MKHLFLVITCMFLLQVCAFAENKEVVTFIIDESSQPPLVGAEISNVNEGEILKRGFVVSLDESTLSLVNVKDTVRSHTNLNGYGDKPVTTTLFDCSDNQGEQFSARLKHLQSNSVYYVRAYVIVESDTIYGNSISITSQTFNRYSGYQAYGNVWYAFSYQLFDLVSDEYIDPNTEGFYYSTNENPTVCRHQTGTSYNTCYKYKTYWNYKIWYYAGSPNKIGLTSMPKMTYIGNELSLTSNDGDTIYYCVNGDGLRPENFTDKYTSPISVNEGDVIFCYAVSSNNIPSEVNVYKVCHSSTDTHEYVDLGLPSGTLWATCNIGATSPEEYGDYFSWGETSPKTEFSSSNYRFYNDGSYTKYNSTDGKTTLDLEDDAAHVLWGQEWRIPSAADRDELIDNCTWELTYHTNIYGYQITGSNGNSIFLPAGGYYNQSFKEENQHGVYWLNELYDSNESKNISFGLSYYNKSDPRYSGLNIRPVIDGPHFTKQPTADDLSVEVSWTDSANYQWYYYPTSGITTYDDWTSSNAGQSSSSSSNTYQITGTAGQELTFDWSVSSETNYDKLTVTIDGVNIIQQSGVQNGTYSYTFDSDKSITIVATYSKDGSVNNNDDQASIINMCLKSAPVIVEGATSSNLEDRFIVASGYYYCQVSYSNSSIVLKSNEVYVEAKSLETTDISTLPYAVYASNDATGRKNSQITVPINMKNSNAITLWQADLQLPTGFSIATDEYGDPLISIAGSRTTASRHSIATSTLANGKTRILCSSSTNKTFSGTDGQVAAITLNVANDVTIGEYPLILSNILMVETDETKHNVDSIISKVTIKSYTLGDVNDDGSIDGADLVGIVNYIMQTPKAGNIEEAADVNKDGVIDGSDYVREVNAILGSVVLNAKPIETASAKALNIAAAANEASPYSLFTDDASCKSGNQVTLSIKMNNENAITLWQGDLVLPEGVTVAEDEFGDPMISITGRTTLARHSLASSKLSDGSIRLLCSSTTNKNFSGTSGEVAQVTLNVPDGMKAGDYIVMLKNILLVESNETKHNVESTISALAVEGPSTDINSVVTDKAEDSVIYNISGQRINNANGIYIKNGKKYVVK